MSRVCIPSRRVHCCVLCCLVVLPRCCGRLLCVGQSLPFIVFAIVDGCSVRQAGSRRSFVSCFEYIYIGLVELVVLVALRKKLESEGVYPLNIRCRRRSA